MSSDGDTNVSEPATAGFLMGDMDEMRARWDDRARREIAGLATSLAEDESITGEVLCRIVNALRDSLDREFSHDETCRACMSDGRLCRNKSINAYPVPLCALHWEKFEAGVVNCVRNQLRDKRTIFDYATLIEIRSSIDDRLRDLHPDAPDVKRLPQGPKKPTDLYFARSLLGGDLIKIGVSANVPARMRDLKAEALLVLPGEAKREDELHTQFAHLRVVGEWFRPERDLLAFIDERQAA